MAKAKNFGIQAILRIYNRKLLLKGAIMPFILTFIIVALFSIFGKVDISILGVVVDLILTIIPSLLGFVLSGYALLIGFGNIEVIAKKSKKDNDSSENKPTLYQKVSAVFAIGLIMQVLLLVFTFGLKILLKVELPCLCGNISICNITNYIIFTLLIFGLFYVVVMIKDLVINIFNFSQVQHFYINKSPKTNGEKY